MSLQKDLTQKVIEAVGKHYGVELPTVEFQPTRKDFEGDITLVVFPMLRYIKGNPAQIADRIGAHLQEEVAQVAKYNVVQGFLNLVIADGFYVNFFNDILDAVDYGFVKASSQDAIMVEYSSPNTNKPLHLGHIRNNLLGYSVAEILRASGKKVYKTQIINDRGIHICKSMLAWQKSGKGETPSNSGKKGDHLVGEYYVAFDQDLKKEIKAMVEGGMEADTAAKEAPLLLEAQEMLRKWEAGDPEVVALWKMMNTWVYEGFESTYTKLGVDFDALYYESD